MRSVGPRLKRAYDPPSADDGARVLVERLWPRVVSKERAAEIEELLTLAERGRLTLVMGSRDVEHSSAAVLKAYLEDAGR